MFSQKRPSVVSYRRHNKMCRHERKPQKTPSIGAKLHRKKWINTCIQTEWDDKAGRERKELSIITFAYHQHCTILRHKIGSSFRCSCTTTTCPKKIATARSKIFHWHLIESTSRLDGRIVSLGWRRWSGMDYFISFFFSFSLSRGFEWFGSL